MFVKEVNNQLFDTNNCFFNLQLIFAQEQPCCESVVT